MALGLFLFVFEGVVVLFINKGTSHHKGWLQLLYRPGNPIVFVELTHTYFEKGFHTD